MLTPNSTTDNHVLHDEDGRERARTFQRQLHPLQTRKRSQQQHRLETNNSYLSSKKLRFGLDFRESSHQSSEKPGYSHLSLDVPSSPRQPDTRGFVGLSGALCTPSRLVLELLPRDMSCNVTLTL